ncbi:ParA family protein [Desulfobacterales bacterium HSG2]|nr:ParA family protein [Desulfobacterales bacterium HSG2]
MAYPKVVSVVSLKGVGKTTLCVNLAYGLSYFLNKKVLLVDLDPQANATQYLMSQRMYKKLYLAEESRKKTVVEVYDELRIADRQSLLKNCDRFVHRIYKSENGYLYLLASKIELCLMTFQSSGLPKYDEIRRFIESVGGDYEFVFIDCPTVSSMLYAGLSAAQSVLVPIKPDFLSTIGLPLLHRIITEEYPAIRRPDWIGEISVLGLVYNMVDNRLKMTTESMSDIRKVADRLNYDIFESRISNSAKFAWSSKRTLPVFRSEPSSRYAEEIENLVNEFIERIEGE